MNRNLGCFILSLLLFTSSGYAQIESGKNFKIISFDKLINCSMFKKLTLGVDPKLFTHNQINKFFIKKNSDH